MELSKIIGLRVVAIRGVKERKNEKSTRINYILFGDGETYIEVQDQDYYTYHDCSPAAKELIVWRNKRQWDRIMSNSIKYGDSNRDL